VTMTEPIPEPVVVQLTRMEGKTDLVIQRLDDIIPRVSALEVVSATHGMDIQQLKLEAKARDEKATERALAIKEAKETQEADAKRAWSPVQRLAVVSAAVLASIQIYQSFLHGVG
jgi:hypothetical protein